MIGMLCVVAADGSQLVSPGLFLYGNDVVGRKINLTNITGFKKSWIDPNHLLHSGFLSRYFLYANAADRPGQANLLSPTHTRIQIWRPDTGAPGSPNRPKFRLVWQRRVLLNTTVDGLLFTVSALHIRRRHTVYTRGDVAVLLYY